MATSEITAQETLTYSWQHYYEMTKPKVVLLIAFTALVGMLLSTDGLTPWQPLLFGLIGISLAAACGAVINHIIDQRIDAVMDRTHWRPFPSGHMDTPHALAFALLLGAVSMLTSDPAGESPDRAADLLRLDRLCGDLHPVSETQYPAEYRLGRAGRRRAAAAGLVRGDRRGHHRGLSAAADHLRLDPASLLAPGDPSPGRLCQGQGAHATGDPRYRLHQTTGVDLLGDAAGGLPAAFRDSHERLPVSGRRTAAGLVVSSTTRSNCGAAKAGSMPCRPSVIRSSI